MYDYIIVGGGILGIATGSAVARQYPGSRILVIEKEDRCAMHQTGRNSGVIHSGVYYKAGSLKASLATAGNASMQAYCTARGIPCRPCGKVIVATDLQELPLLERLVRQADANHVPYRRLTPDELRDYEPHACCVAAVRIESTAVTDFHAVCRSLLNDFRSAGGEFRGGTELFASSFRENAHWLETTSGTLTARFLIACAGLQCDRVARRSGMQPDVRIVPFRGEYYELREEKRHLVNSLIYPVPDPAFPFLGVHLTHGINGTVHAGPNAVLALEREGYGKWSFGLRDAFDTLTYGGFWKLAARYWRQGAAETFRSLNKSAFVHSLQRLVPEISQGDLVPAKAGVRAQALARDGRLVDDFVLQRGERSLFVLNAPSPAATASLEIAKYILANVPGPERSSISVAGFN